MAVYDVLKYASRCSTTAGAATPRWATARRFGSSRTGSASMRLSNPWRH